VDTRPAEGRSLADAYVTDYSGDEPADPLGHALRFIEVDDKGGSGTADKPMKPGG